MVIQLARLAPRNVGFELLYRVDLWTNYYSRTVPKPKTSGTRSLT